MTCPGCDLPVYASAHSPAVSMAMLGPYTWHYQCAMDAARRLAEEDVIRGARRPRAGLTVGLSPAVEDAGPTLLERLQAAQTPAPVVATLDTLATLTLLERLGGA